MATLTTSWQYLDQKYIGSSGGNLYVRLYARYSEQDIANNRTYVYYQARSYYDRTYIQDDQGTIGVSGTGASYQNAGCTRPTTGESVSVTTSGWVYHNNDGTCSVTGNASINFPNWGWSGTITASANLPQIPRASGVACSSPYIGDNAIISIDKKSSSFTNTLTYKIGTLTGTIATKTSNTTVQFQTSSIADSIYALIPNGTETSGTIYCTTYNGSTQIGDTQSTSFNLYAKESVCKPSVTATIVDTNTDVTNITGSNTKFIKYISKPKVTINATAKKSSSIKKYYVSLNDGQTSSTKETSFSTIGSNKVNVSATDSRNYVGYNDYTLDMIDYIKLHINTISITRPEGTSNEAILNCNGAYYNGSFSDTVTNTLSGSFKYRKSGETDWTDGGSITPTITNNTFKITNLSLGTSFDYNEEYQFKVILKDKFLTVGSSDTEVITLPKGQETIAIGDKEIWLYGNAYLNDETIGVNKNSTNSSIIDGYSCDYINKQIKNISYCKMTTSFETKEITNSAQITGWGNGQDNGDLGAYPSRNRLEIKNTSLVALMGKTCGQYGMVAYLELRDSDDNLILGNNQQGSILVQPTGNQFWSQSLPTMLVKLDSTKTYYVTLWANGYNDGNTYGTAYMNNGFGKNGTWMAAVKLM